MRRRQAELTGASPFAAVEGAGDAPVLRLSGVWRLGDLAEIDAALARLDLRRARGEGTGPVPAVLRIDGGALDALDTAAAMVLLRRCAGAGFAFEALALESFDPRHRRIVEVVAGRMPAVGRRVPTPRRDAVHRFGEQVVAFGALLHGHLSFLGLVLVELARALLRPGILRGRELMVQFAHVCVSAVPVVVLVTFLIGTIVAYLLGQQAEQYGASIFVVDGVALGMVREFSPLIVATIVAGRSGAAFTAQLGTMRLTEEIDAVRTLGLSPAQVLVVPRVLALVLSLPLLIFAGDVAGMAGGMLVADVMLDLTPATFADRVQSALAVRHYLIGLAKGPVFALFIAVIGCRMGIAASRDTRSVGANTTSTVVQSIVAVILLDALFAVVLQELRL